MADQPRDLPVSAPNTEITGSCCCCLLSCMGSGDQIQVRMLEQHALQLSENLPALPFLLHIGYFLITSHAPLLPDLQRMNGRRPGCHRFPQSALVFPVLFLSTPCDPVHCQAQFKLLFFLTKKNLLHYLFIYLGAGSHYVVWP